MDLELDGSEVGVGSFSADLLLRDTNTGARVVIENLHTESQTALYFRHGRSRAGGAVILTAPPASPYHARLVGERHVDTSLTGRSWIQWAARAAKRDPSLRRILGATCGQVSATYACQLAT